MATPAAEPLAASTEPPAPPSGIALEVKGEQVEFRAGSRFWRIRGLEKNTSFEQLRVNVLCSNAGAFHVDTLDLYSARQRAAYIKQAATELGATPTPEVLRTPKLLVHYAAKAEGKLSFGLLRSVADYADLPAIEAAGREAREHGFDGATCVHPSVVPILNAAFAPDDAEIAWAERVVAASKSGAGGFTVDGRMVDRPVLLKAQAILREAGVE